MQESIRIQVMISETKEKDEFEADLEFRFEGSSDIFQVFLDEKEICYSEYAAFRKLFARALKLWGVDAE